MHISGSNSVDFSQVKVASVSSSVKSADAPKQGSKVASNKAPVLQETVQVFDNSEETKKKVQEAVSKMNEMLEVNNSHSKFVYHEGLERYYVTVVDRDTDEVVKEIPPKKLLDAFYEMQKMLGMIVDEKI